MASSSCWSCGADIGPNYNYCGDCGVPVAPFQPTSGEGFLSRESLYYVKAVVDGDVSYPADSTLDEALQAALKEQLQNDVERAVIQLGAVCRADDKLLLRSVDFSFFEERAEGEETDLDDLPPSFLGFVRLVQNLVEVLPQEMFDILREGSDSER